MPNKYSRQSSTSSLLSFKSIRRASIESWNSVTAPCSPRRRASFHKSREHFHDVDPIVLSEVRGRVLGRIEKDPMLFHDKDITLIKTDDWFLTRFVLDVDEKGDIVERAVKSIEESLIWRNNFGVNNFVNFDFPREFYECGIVSLSRSPKGMLILHIRISLYKKIGAWTDVVIAFMMHELEQLRFLAEPYQQVGLVIDCCNAGYNSVDCGLCLQVVPLMTKHYPCLVSFIYVLELPWLLKAVSSTVVGLLPAKQKKLIKFIDRKQMRELLGDDAMPDYLGGCATTWMAVPDDCATIDMVGKKRGIGESDIKKCREHCDKLIKASSKKLNVKA